MQGRVRSGEGLITLNARLEIDAWYSISVSLRQSLVRSTDYMSSIWRRRKRAPAHAKEKEREQVGEEGKRRVLTAFVNAQHSYNHCRLLLVVLAYSPFPDN